MATNQQQDRQNQQNSQPGNAQGGAEQRSEGLLPADGQDDGRFEVAEEVNLDQQSDAAQHVGQAPEGIASDALADTLKGKRG